MANLILSQDYVPQVRPEPVTQANYPKPEEYEQAFQLSKIIAKRSGHWLTEEWKKQELDIKMADMMVLTMKNYISYLKIWPDAVEETIRTSVRDAFDIYLVNNLTDIDDSPFIIDIVPKLISKIKANENFDPKQLEKISPDNRYASDEIKEAYLTSKFGKAGSGSDTAATLLQKEAFLTEYISDDNLDRIRGQKENKKMHIPGGAQVLKDKKKGDPIIRHVFVAGKVWLRDIYTTLPGYPYVDLRLEPGPIYGTSQIERFIPANKSLDSVMSRIERFIHTMNVGVWQKRKGESFEITNVAGGLVAEYESTPPQQMQLATLTNTPFNFVDLLNSFIEEQGVTTSALGKVPKGVKAGVAIESLKASEFANLFIPIKQLKQTIRRISEKFFDIADSHFINRQTVDRLDRGEPDYFDIIGQAGVDARKDLDEADPLEGVVPIKKDYKVDIEIQSGLGYTEEGKKAAMMELSNFILAMAKEGAIPPDAVKVVVKRLVEVFKFGPTAEIMDALDAGDKGLEDEQLQQIKLAVIEVLKDAKGAGLFEPDEDKHLNIAKAGMAEVIKDTGLADKEPEPTGSIERTETVEDGKDGRKTKTETKTKI